MAKTVYVIGAGASMEVNMPSGKELKEKISACLTLKYNRSMDNQFLIEPIQKAIVQEWDDKREDHSLYMNAIDDIQRGMPDAISIDQYIHVNQHNEKIKFCGKIAIADQILKCEQQSLISDLNSRDNKKFDPLLEKTWLYCFFQIYVASRNIDELKKVFSEITLIIFNYDRCFEHYLFHKISNFYSGIEQTVVKEIMDCLTIIHPYGRVGKLPWEKGEEIAIAFGDTPTPDELRELTGSIKVFTESEIVSGKTNIRDAIYEASAICFLGFGFIDQNLKLIDTSGYTELDGLVPNTKRIQVYGTIFGLSDIDQGEIKNNLKKVCSMTQLNPKSNEIILRVQECHKFLNNIKLRLANTSLHWNESLVVKHK